MEKAKPNLKNLIKNILNYFLVYIPVEYLYSCYEYIRIQRLKSNIKHIGENCMISHNFFVMSPDKLVIKDNVSFGRGVRIMGAGDVMIGEDTMIANGVTILTTTHDSRAEKMKGTGMHKAVTIGQDCWIGANATILPGVTIYDNSIVGAGAVVVKDVMDCEVVVSPYAKVVRKRKRHS